MDPPRRPPRPEPLPEPSEEVVRLPVPENDLATRLEAMPVPKCHPRKQPETQIELHQETVETAEPWRSETDVRWEEDDRPRRHETPLGWFALIGAILLGLGVWALANLRQGEEVVGQRAGQIEDGRKQEEQSLREAEALLAEVERQTRAYLAASSIVDKAAFVRHSERVLPLMESYYARLELTPARLASISDLRPFAIEKRPFIYVAAKLESGERRPLLMEQTAEGDLRFDWESEVAYQPMSLDEYIERKPAEPLSFRVYARLDNFYSFEFSDAERYQALRLTEREGEGFLFGYLERGTLDERRLMEMLAPSPRVPKPVLLRVRFLPETRSRRSVLVEELVSPRWIYAEDPGAAAAPGPAPQEK